MDKRSYAVIGSGALGAYYGARLHHIGCDVHFLFNSDYSHVIENGLIVNATDGDFSIPNPNAYASVDNMPKCDIVIVGLKTTSNHLLQKLLPPVVKDDGLVLVLQNGYGIEDQVAQIVGPTRVAGGLAFLCSNKIGPGHIQHLDYGLIRFADYAPNNKAAGITPRIQSIANDFERSGIPVVVEEDLILARWKKLVWNIPFNGLSVILNTTTDNIMRNPHTRQLSEDLMREVALGAAAFNRTIDEDFIQLMMTNTDKMVAYKPSMLLDYHAKRPMEVEAIFGEPLRAAQSKNQSLPKIQTLYQQLSYYDTLRNQ